MKVEKETVQVGHLADWDVDYCPGGNLLDGSRDSRRSVPGNHYCGHTYRRCCTD